MQVRPELQQVDCFDAIQDGLSAVAAGGTVYVAGEMYDTSVESFPIAINKPVTLVGAQAGVDPRPSFGSTRALGSVDEAIVDGGGIFSNIFTIYANDVTLDGLEVGNGTVAGHWCDPPSQANSDQAGVRR